MYKSAHEFLIFKEWIHYHIYKMIIISLFIISLILSICLIISINPISIGIIILLYALITTIIFSITTSSWLAFSIFLIYIRGILVLFSYFTAISPNIPIPSIIINLIIFIIIPFTIIISKSIFINSPIIYKNTQFIISLYINQFFYSILLLIIILLVTIIIVVKLVHLTSGPLRPFSYV